MTRTPAASSGGLSIRALYPGTDQVPAPKPAALPAISADPLTQPSQAAAAGFMGAGGYYTLPAIGVVSTRHMGPWQHIWWRRGPMPMPAVNVVRQAAPLFTPARIGGSKVTNWPAAQPKWATYG
jgi:hypothetical protein